MVLIIGGMSQGKLRFARRELGVAAWNDSTLGEENCVYRLHEAIRTLDDPENAVSAWCENHPDGVMICDEVGCGITPLDRAERSWREQVGRICCHIAEQSNAVYRVSCGLGVRIK